MDIDGQICLFAYDAHNLRAEGNVIDKMSIHDVAMDPIRPSLFHAMNFICKP